MPATDKMRRPFTRRSGRIPKPVPVLLHWQDYSGHDEEELVETVLVSRFGFSTRCHLRPPAGCKVSIWYPERRKTGRGRIVYREMTGCERTTQIAVEIVDDPDFWEIEFPPSGRL